MADAIVRMCPLMLGSCPAGFPNPAEDFLEGELDLGAHLVRHPTTTFFIRATGKSMMGAGINPGDLLVVDRSLRPRDGHVVIAVLDDGFTVKRLRRGSDGQMSLVADNADFPPITLSADGTCQVWGVCTVVVHWLTDHAGADRLQ